MEPQVQIRRKTSRRKDWGELEASDLKTAADLLKELESPGHRVVSVGYGKDAKGDKPGFPTVIEVGVGEKRSNSWFRILIHGNREAKKLMIDSPKVLKFLGHTAQSL